MTVGFFSPLPPQRTGVADYAASLLDALKPYCSIRVAPRDAAINLYHIGNNQLHAEIYTRALEQPGVVVLHDAVLHHFFLGYLNEHDYTEEFVYNYGSWNRHEAESLWRSRARSGADARYFGYPMLRRICERSLAVIVHNPAAAALVLQHAPGARVHEIPMIAAQAEPARAQDVDGIRRDLGVSGRTCLAGIFGYLRETKRIASVARTFNRLAGLDLALVLAGPMDSRDLERGLKPYSSAPWLRRVEFLKGSRFRGLAQAVDLCINLRYPNAGETSAIGVTLMAAGKPVLFSDDQTVARLPQDACLRVQTGIQEEPHLEYVLRWLQQSSQHRFEIGRRAASYIARQHAPENVGALYWSALTSAVR
ncbi:MAG TPA: hypothetical protein VEQ63_12980 [Bryobacteraceae bacterium]|nr:hypothetical protein [Bryobacteraceae bacterium]